MVELNPCKICGGAAEVYKKWIPVLQDYRPVIGYRCSRCHARTMLRMTETGGTTDEEALEYTRDLWNRGRISGEYDAV